MKVMVLGGSGSIGSGVVPDLLRAGHEVLAVSRSAASDQHLRAMGAQTVRGSLTDTGAWAAQLAGSDALIQLAASFDGQMAQADSHAMDVVMAQAARRYIPLRLLYTGGGWLYGATGNRIARDGAPFRPIAPFDWMRVNAQRLMGAPGLSVAVLHPASVYHQEGGAFSRFLASARSGRPFEFWGKPDTRWPLIHRDDLAAAYRLLLEQPELTGSFNAASESGVPVRAIANEAARRHGHDGSYIVRTLKHVLQKYGAWAEGPTLDLQMAADRLRALGWQPRHRRFQETAF